jgi:hypothetical protein
VPEDPGIPPPPLSGRVCLSPPSMIPALEPRCPDFSLPLAGRSDVRETLIDTRLHGGLSHQAARPRVPDPSSTISPSEKGTSYIPGSSISKRSCGSGGGACRSRPWYQPQWRRLWRGHGRQQRPGYSQRDWRQQRRRFLPRAAACSTRSTSETRLEARTSAPRTAQGGDKQSKKDGSQVVFFKKNNQKARRMGGERPFFIF